MARSSVRLVLGICLAAVVTLLAIGNSLAATVAKGQPDPSFGSGGFVAVAGANLLGVAVQSDGKVVAVGDNGANPIRLMVERFNTNGSVDPGFNGGHPALGPSGSIGRAVAVQADGKIVVAGALTSSDGGTPAGMLVERFNTNGAADGSFGSGGTATALSSPQQGGLANAVALQSDGKIVAAGSANASDAYPRTAFARLNANGALDGSFGSGGLATVDLGRYSVANGVKVASDGRIVFAGSQRPDLRVTNVIVGRLTSAGNVDASFAGGGFVRQLASGAAFSAAYGLDLTPDGKVVAAGGASDGVLGATGFALRLTASGSLDGGFGSGGVVKVPAAVGGASQCGTCDGPPPPPGASAVVVSAGEVFFAGYFDQNNRKRFSIYGLTSGGALDPGFGSAGAVAGPLLGSNQQASALAVAPGGNLVLTGFQSGAFSSTASFVARYGGPFVTPPPPPPPALKAKVSVKGRYKLSSVTGKAGLRFTVTCSVACRVSASLSVSYGDAKRLKLAPRRGHPKTVTIVSGSASARKAGKLTLTLHFRRNVGRALSKQRSVKTTLSVISTARGSAVATAQGITLAR